MFGNSSEQPDLNKKLRGSLHVKQPQFSFEKKNKLKMNVFKDAFKKADNMEDAMKLQQEEPKNAYDNLKYGSSITLNFVGEKDKKLCTKLRISDKVSSLEMPSDEYNIN